MDWITYYQLFLFDFDGLLVDTENLHFQAYIEMCRERGFELNWDFQNFSEAAHHSSTGLRDRIYTELPDLKTKEPDWNVLYEEKKRIFLDLIDRGNVALMPGVSELLLALQQAGIRRCVVTHSALSLIQRIRRQNSILDTIPHWITREDYMHPKPHSECYRNAVSRFANPNDKIIGFEDSPRGLEALLGAEVQSVLICPPDSSYLQGVLNLYPSLKYFPNFLAIRELGALTS